MKKPHDYCCKRGENRVLFDKQGGMLFVSFIYEGKDCLTTVSIEFCPYCGKCGKEECYDKKNEQ